jgi:glycosyltransferase involved in cell wall biosynthesis
MAEAIAHEGHSVHIVCYHFGDGTPPKGVEIHHIPDLGFGRKVVVGPTVQKPLLDLQMVFTLSRVIRREKIDLIHAHNYEGALVGYLASLLTGRPLLYNACNTMGDELASYGFFRPRILAVWLARFLDYWVPRLPHQTIAISDELGKFLLGQGVSPERLHVIPLGIDPAIFDGVDPLATRARLGLGNEPLVVYTGGLDGLQRIDYLLQAMSVVVAGNPKAKLLLLVNAVKEGDLERYKAMAESLGIAKSVNFIPSDSFEQVPPYLAIADATVVPRPSCPGFPVKLLNYLAAGRPVAVFEGSAKGLWNGKTALLAPDHDWQALGKAILEILSDPALAERLGREGRQWVIEKYSWPVLTEQTLRVYDQMLSRRSSPALSSLKA